MNEDVWGIAFREALGLQQYQWAGVPYHAFQPFGVRGVNRSSQNLRESQARVSRSGSGVLDSAHFALTAPECGAQAPIIQDRSGPERRYTFHS